MEKKNHSFHIKDWWWLHASKSNEISIPEATKRNSAWSIDIPCYQELVRGSWNGKHWLRLTTTPNALYQGSLNFSGLWVYVSFGAWKWKSLWSVVSLPHVLPGVWLNSPSWSALRYSHNLWLGHPTSTLRAEISLKSVKLRYCFVQLHCHICGFNVCMTKLWKQQRNTMIR